MQRLLKALVLSTFCLTAASCDKQRIVTNLAPPSERLVCVATAQRPSLTPEYVIDWSRVTTVAQAHAEHDKFVAVLRTREGRIAGYILQIEGQLYACGSNMQWLRDWYKATAR